MGDIELQIFSERLKELRISLGLTQAQFVEELGITASALSAYEKNLKNPSISVAKRIAEKYGVSIDWLCGLSDNKTLSDDMIWTYSDIINLCSKTSDPTKAANAIMNKFVDRLEQFIAESKQMESLKKDGLIDQELYELWLEKTLRKYKQPIMLHYCEKIIDPFSKKFISEENTNNSEE